jgi:hypothetical protein
MPSSDGAHAFGAWLVLRVLAQRVPGTECPVQFRRVGPFLGLVRVRTDEDDAQVRVASSVTSTRTRGSSADRVTSCENMVKPSLDARTLPFPSLKSLIV